MISKQSDNTPRQPGGPAKPRALLQAPLVNRWPLFWLLVLPMTAAIVASAQRLQLSAPEDVSRLIACSVRWAVPFIFLVTAASALPRLLPGEFPKWLLRNRRYLGLVFAVAMAWQGAFIAILSTQHSAFYYADVYVLRDELEGSSGYLLLTAMVITSFGIGRRRLSHRQWKTLHRSGVYFLWAYAFSVYWWNLYFYRDAQPLDHVYYWAGFLALAARIAAWGRDRRKNRQARAALPARIAGKLLIVGGLVVAATGDLWYEPVSAVVLAADWSADLERWLPFWPFQPFYSLMLIGAGTWLTTATAARRDAGSLAATRAAC
jgi:DMSO/TMAO reductase YedYZ heme-binding membrane subunit